MRNYRVGTAGRFAVASIVAAGMGLSAAPAHAAGGPAFTISAVNKTYNFSFSGRNGSGHEFAMVGWLQVNENGTVTDGGARGSLVGATTAGSTSMHVDASADNRITVSDPTNGIYELKLRLVSPLIAPMEFTLHVLLDDPRGRSGRMSGHYQIYVPENGGVGLGEIISQ